MVLARSQFRFRLESFELVVFNDFTNSQPLSGLVTGIPEEQVVAALRKLGFPPAAALLDTNVQSPIDSEPAEAAQTRQSLVCRAADSDMLVASAHLPFPGLGHVEAQGERWLWRPIA